ARGWGKRGWCGSWPAWRPSSVGAGPGWLGSARSRRGSAPASRCRWTWGPHDSGPPNPLVRPVSLDEIESLAIGAWILGTGGGGSPYLALLNMRQLYRQGVVCQLMDASELADDDLVAVVSNMGAPPRGQERLTDPTTVG